MVKITRWFPVSHDINADPDLWKMRKQIGEKALAVWLEFLSIADRNEGLLVGDLEELIRHVAAKCQATKRTVTAVYEAAITLVWVVCDPTPRVVNYAKFHKTRETNKRPSYPSEPSEPSKPNHKTPIAPKGDVTDFAFERFWDSYPKKIGKVAALRAWRREAASLKDVQEKIFAALLIHTRQEQWQKEKGRFIPHPATWLNQRRWNDEINTQETETMRPPWETLKERQRAEKNIR